MFFELFKVKKIKLRTHLLNRRLAQMARPAQVTCTP